MKRMTIEEMLRWAFVTELPKQRGSGGAVSGWSETYVASNGDRASSIWSDTFVPVQNSHGVVIDEAASTPAHPDAVLLGEAVKTLDGEIIELPEDWNPIPDLGMFSDEIAAAIDEGCARLFVGNRDGGQDLPGVHLRVSISRLVQKHALLGGCPDWLFDPPKRKTMRGPNGQNLWWRKVEQRMPTCDGSVSVRVIEVDGFNDKSRRPYPGAYMRTCLDPAPWLAVVSRAEYQLWRMALDRLCEEVSGRLVAHDLIACGRSYVPWEDGGESDHGESRRVLDDLTRMEEVGDVRMHDVEAVRGKPMKSLAFQRHAASAAAALSRAARRSS